MVKELCNCCGLYDESVNEKESICKYCLKAIEKGRLQGQIDFAERVKGILKVGLEHNETLEGFEEAFIELEEELKVLEGCEKQ